MVNAVNVCIDKYSQGSEVVFRPPNPHPHISFIIIDFIVFYGAF